MPWTINVDGNDYNLYMPLESFTVEETGSQVESWLSVCRFQLRDATGTVSVEPEDEVEIIDPGGSTVWFAGKVKDVTMYSVGLTQVWEVACVDWNCLLDEHIVTSYTIDEDDDDDIEIAAMFAAFLSSVDASTYVNQLETEMPELLLEALTIREAMDEICRITGGRYYIDYDLNLHYFELDRGGLVAWDATDDPAGVHGGYRDLQIFESSAQMATRVFVLGDGVGDWVTGASYSAGDPEAVLRDSQITTTDELIQRGNALLARYEAPRHTVELTTIYDKPSLGNLQWVRSQQWGDDHIPVRQVQWRFLAKDGDRREYRVVYDDEPKRTYVWERDVMAKLRGLEALGNQIIGDWPDATALNDMLIADATPAWTILTGPTAAEQVLLSAADPYTPSWQALFDATVPGTIVPDAAAATGSAVVAARRDHTHGITCDAPTGTLTEATANAEGSASTFARSDHTHDIDVSGTRAPHDAQYVVLAVDGELSAERVLTSGDGIAALADGGANSTITVALGTPSTLTVSTSNGLTATSHTHAITSSSDPGAAASILATNASGYLELVSLGIGTTPTVANTIPVVDNTWIGLGAAAGRIVFDDQATDQVEIQNAMLLVNTGSVDSNQSGNIAELHEGHLGVSGADGEPAVAQVFAYGSAASDDMAIVRLRRARNTQASPAAAQSGDALGRVGAGGRGASAWPSQSTGYVQFLAAENFTNTAMGTHIQFATTPTGSVTPAEQMRISASGRVKIGGTFATISGQVHIAQENASGAVHCLYLEQDDLDFPFIAFEGTAAAADLTRSIVDEGDQASETREGWIKVRIEDNGNQITDGGYFVPVYSLSS